MAEFFDVMIEMNRMHNDYEDCDDGCPLHDKNFCNKPNCEIDEEDIKEAERVIMKWSKEHPVVYPTWGEFFKLADLEDARLTDSVRADIAVKLGLKPVRSKKMTIQRMVELLKIEHECMLRKSHNGCDGQCDACELVQDDNELHEMYMNVIGLVGAQELLEPKKVNRYIDWGGEGNPYVPGIYDCGNCGKELPDKAKYCPECGMQVKQG